MTDREQAQNPHWEQLLSDLWQLAGEETFETVNVIDYCEQNDYDQEIVTKTLEIRPAWDYVEWGVSPRFPWFYEEYDPDA